MTAWFKKKSAMPLPPPPEPLTYDSLPQVEELAAPPSDLPPISVSQMPPVELPNDAPKMQKPSPPPQKITTTYSEKGMYENVLADMKSMDLTLKQSQTLLEELNEVKVAADTHLEEWRMTLEDVERKLLYIDNVLFEK